MIQNSSLNETIAIHRCVQVESHLNPLVYIEEVAKTQRNGMKND